MAYRNLRKDDNPSHPEQLGIVKDPNAVISSHSCWKHKMEQRLKEPQKINPFPHIDYPVRNPKLLNALSTQIRKLIRKQSQNANAQTDPILTYEDLLKNPEIMKSMKSEFGIEEAELKARPDWQGKTIYELLKLKTDSSTTSDDNDKFSTAQSHSPSPPPLELTVQHCQLEISPPLGFANEDKSSKASFTTTLVDDQSTSNLRQQERVESEEKDDDDNEMSNNEGELMECCNPSAGFLPAFLDHPAFLTVCYCLALMHQLGQLGGLDFLSTLGMVLAMISMMSMLFI